MGEKHIPTRRCLGCGARAPQRELVRFVAAGAGAERTVVRDDGTRQPGRGLYVCPTRECFARAVERNAFARAARLAGIPLRIDPTVAAEFDV